MNLNEHIDDLHTSHRKVIHRVGNLAFVPFIRAISDLRIVGFDRVKDVPPPWIVVFNHVSMADGAIAEIALPRTIRNRCVFAVAADTVFKKPGLREISVYLGNAIPFDRTEFDMSLAYAVADLLRDGWSCCISPEGTRYPNGSGGPFQGTPALFSHLTGAPIIMQHIDGAGSVLPKGKVVPRHGRVTVTYGEPLFPDPTETRRQLQARLEAKYVELAQTTGCLVDSQEGFVDSSPWRSAWREHLLAEPEKG